MKGEKRSGRPAKPALRMLDKEPDESARRKAIEDFHELCRAGTENRERQGISVEEADQAIEEAVRPVRSKKTG